MVVMERGEMGEGSATTGAQVAGRVAQAASSKIVEELRSRNVLCARLRGHRVAAFNSSIPEREAEGTVSKSTRNRDTSVANMLQQEERE